MLSTAKRENSGFLKILKIETVDRPMVFSAVLRLKTQKCSSQMNLSNPADSFSLWSLHSTYAILQSGGHELNSQDTTTPQT